jgi:hypothetical protein
MKLKEIAEKIAAHLKRFEADARINVHHQPSGVITYYHPHAWAAGSRVGVKYVAYQLDWFLTKQEALDYLEALDGGFTGKHFKVRKEKA